MNLEQLYYDPRIPGAFGGNIEKIRKQYKGRQDVKTWFKKQIPYTIHKPVRKKFARRRVIVSGPGDQLQTDLVDMQEFTNKNDGYKYLLTVIDVFSKYAWVVPLKNKTAESVISAFKKIDLKNIRVQSDRGDR